MAGTAEVRRGFFISIIYLFILVIGMWPANTTGLAVASVY